MGVSRSVYNRTLDVLKDSSVKANWKAIKIDIIKDKKGDWEDLVPYQIRSISVKEACKTVTRCKLLYKQDGKIHKAKHRAKHQPKQHLYIPKQSINDNGFFRRTLGDMKFAEPLPEMEHDCVAVMEYGVWYVCIPVKITAEVPRTKELVVALDPGVRTFQTFYSPRVVGSIGDRAWEKLLKLCYALDQIKSKLTNKDLRAKNRRQLRIAEKRLTRLIKYKKEELHWKTAAFLAKSFRLIVIPKFSAGEMSRKAKRKIGSKTVRMMLTLAHSEFRERLKWAAAKYGSQVFEVSEAYTSRTCTRCGHDHTKLGGAKTYVCPECGLKISRDYNGARNILLRAIPDLVAALCGLSIDDLVTNEQNC